MPAVTVFVDEAVQGRLPWVCVKDGVPAEGLFRIEQEVGGGARLGVAWLLAFFGPVGWLVLFLLAVSRSGRGEVLAVRLPYSEAAVDRYARATVQLRWCVGTAVAGGALLVVSIFSRGGRPGIGYLPQVGIWAALFVIVAAFVVAFIVELGRQRQAVDIRLDASRRWVTLSRVHPLFVASVEQTGLSSER